MLIWLLSITGALALGAIFVIRNAELDDKRRKLSKRRPIPDRWK